MKQSIKKERECEDCGDPIPVKQLRIRCIACGKLVCSFCYNHSTHQRRVEKLEKGTGK